MQASVFRAMGWLENFVFWDLRLWAFGHWASSWLDIYVPNLGVEPVCAYNFFLIGLELHTSLIGFSFITFSSWFGKIEKSS